MKACFLVPSCRPGMMEALVRSWLARPWRDDFKMLVCLHDYQPDDRSRILDMLDGRLLGVMDGTRRSPYITRQYMIRAYPDVDKWIFLDDDMEFTDETDYSKPLEKIEEPGAGIVSCNWIRTDSAQLRARARYEDRFIEQATVNMSGGMVMSRAVAHEIAASPEVAWTFCDIQAALTAYLAGFKNYRYLGSILIHHIGEANGLRVTYRQQEFSPPDPRWIKVRYRKNPNEPVASGLMMPVPSDVTADAHMEHRRNREQRGWS